MKQTSLRWTKISVWTVVSFILFYLALYGLIMLGIWIQEDSPSITDAVNLVLSPMFILGIYSGLFILWLIFKKDKSVKKFIRDAIPVLLIFSTLYYFNTARNWENILSNDWTKNPALSNASATLEYLKALVKIVITGVISIVSMQYLNHKD